MDIDFLSRMQDHIREILALYKKYIGCDEPLDGDDTHILGTMIQVIIDKIEGNHTIEEAEEIISRVFEETELIDIYGHFRSIQNEGFNLFMKKNKDYGNSFSEDGILGVMIRMKDKLSRFINIALNKGEQAVRNETVRDTLLDYHNYAGMAILLIDRGEDLKKPNTDHLEAINEEIQ